MGKELGIEENIHYSVEKKEYLTDISVKEIDSKTLTKKGNSLIGKFFLRDVEVTTESNSKNNKLTYFVETDKGLQKKDLINTIGKDPNKIFYKKLPSAKDQAFIEFQSVHFVDEEKEKERIENNYDQMIYVINLPEEDIELLKNIEF